MPRRTHTRERMIQSAALLFREQGVDGTSFADVLEHAGAPRGSTYHHFPGGKPQLAEEATRYAGDYIAAGLAEGVEQAQPGDVLDRFITVWTGILRDSNYAAGCPIVAAALEGDRLPAIRDAAGQAFVHWERILTDPIAKSGIPEQQARMLATVAIAAIEGAVVLARAQRSTRPLEHVASGLRQLLSAVTPDPPDERSR